MLWKEEASKKASRTTTVDLPNQRDLNSPPLQQILFRGKNSIISKSLLLYFIKVIIGLPPAIAGDNILACGEAEEAKRKY